MTFMCFPSQLDSTLLRRWACRAAKELIARRAEINELNVFPVPDSDTGSNMAYTMVAATHAASRLEGDTSAQEMAEALALGAVRGARGNSGVVLSQVLCGIADAARYGSIDGAAIARALRIGARLVLDTISSPVEGTVVTVLRAAALEVEDGGRLIEVATNAAQAAHAALAQTPSQLAVLREAGVVDAGGRGLTVLLDALVAELYHAAGKEERPLRIPPQQNTETPQSRVGTTSIDVTDGQLEVMWWTKGADLSRLEKELSTIGSSLAVARASEDSATVHIHCFARHAGKVIENAYAFGKVSDVRVEILPNIYLKSHKQEFPVPYSSEGEASGPDQRSAKRLVIALCPPGSVADLYASAGAVVVCPGSNEPGEDTVTRIARLARHHSASEVIVVPNGMLTRRELASVEQTIHALAQTVSLVPATYLVSGIAALAVHDASQPLAVDTYAMTEAAVGMQICTLESITTDRAKRAGSPFDSAPGPFRVRAGRRTYILDSMHPGDALADVVHRSARRDGERMTVLYEASIGLSKGDCTRLQKIAEAAGYEMTTFAADDLLTVSGLLAQVGVE